MYYIRNIETAVSEMAVSEMIVSYSESTYFFISD